LDSFTDASASVIDLSVTFEGQTKAVFLITAASASSSVNGSGSLLVFIKSQPAHRPEIPEQQQVVWNNKRSKWKECISVG
jgi:hypothetical protein